jgi:hypothetical protein
MWVNVKRIKFLKQKTTKKICIYSYIGSASTIFTFLDFFLYPTPLICYLPLVWHVFYDVAVFALGLYFMYERKQAVFGLMNLANFT